MLDNGRPRRSRRTPDGQPDETLHRQAAAATAAGVPEPFTQALRAGHTGDVTIAIRCHTVTVQLTGETPDTPITGIWRAVAAAYRTAAQGDASDYLLALPAPVSALTWNDHGRAVTVTSTRSKRRRVRRRSPRGPAAALPVLGALGEASRLALLNPATGVAVSAVAVIAIGSVQVAPAHSWLGEPAQPGTAAPAIVIPADAPPAPTPTRTHRAAPTGPAAPTPNGPAPIPTLTTAPPTLLPTPPTGSPEPKAPTPHPSATTPSPAPYGAPAGPPSPTPSGPQPSPQPEQRPEVAPTAHKKPRNKDTKHHGRHRGAAMR